MAESRDESVKTWVLILPFLVMSVAKWLAMEELAPLPIKKRYLFCSRTARA